MTMPTFAIHQVNPRLAFLYDQHMEISPPPYSALPSPHPNIEVPHTLFWGPGADFAKKIQTNGFAPARLGHDSGIGIIQIATPYGPLSVVNTASSMCKVIFGAGTVQFEKKPAAGHFPPLVNLMQCAMPPCPLPVGGLLLCMNTVFVGMTWRDLVMGVVRWAIAVALARAFKWLGTNNGSHWAQRAWQFFPGKLAPGRFSTFAQAAVINLGATAVGDIQKIPVTLAQEGKIALPYQIAQLDLTSGKAKVFYWEVGEVRRANVMEVSGNSLIESAHTPSPETSGGSPAAQATEGVAVLE